MGVIRKKTATRSGEGGVKFVCDICSADITSTIRIRCAHSACNEYDLCVQCFSNGNYSYNHRPATHPFRVIEQNCVPIYDKNWDSDEELLLLDGAEIYGLGSWADIADHIGGYRNKDEVRAHYQKIYLDSSKFPLPERASPHDTELLDEMPRVEFQSRKKRRIEDRKEAAKNTPPTTPKKKSTASVPACHEVEGYMPGRLEFETEYTSEAEEAVQLIEFDPGDGINPRTGELEPEMELKITVMDIYNTRLTQRVERKKVLFEHNLVDYKKNVGLDKRRTKEEMELFKKVKPFAQIMNHEEFDEFCKDLIGELNLRQEITKLQEWRRIKIVDLQGGEKYEQEKVVRQKAMPIGPLDLERFHSGRAKPALIVEPPSGAAALVASELPIRLTSGNNTPPASPGRAILPGDKVLTNSHANGTYTLSTKREKFEIQPIRGVSRLTFSRENDTDLHLLTQEEVELCERTRINPKPYLVIKEAILKEALKGNGTVKKKQAKEICRLEPQEGGRIFDFFVNSGWVGKA